VRAPLREEDPVLVEHRGDAIEVVRLNRSHRHNAVDMPMVRALQRAFEGATERVVVLASASEGHFCAGLDVTLSQPERVEASNALYDVYERMVTHPAPVIAAAGGPAVGAGAQLLAAADLRLLSPDARVRVAGPGHGLAVAAWSLPALVGRGRAIDLCLSMRWVSAREALDIGLATRVEDDPFGAALAEADALARLDAGAVRRVKALVARGSGALELLDAERRGNASWSGWLARDAVERRH
jgi:enoyl-CoA hydratase/carnithine racemase